MGRKLRELTTHPFDGSKQAKLSPRFGGAVFADAQFAFSNITKAVTWSCEEEEDGQRVKVLVVPSDKLDQDTAAAILAVSQGSTGALRRCTTSWRPLWSWRGPRLEGSPRGGL